MSKHATLVWFRHDLRVADNPALSAAIARAGPVVPVFIHAPGEQGEWPIGAAASVWLHESLAALATALRGLGSPLVVRRGASAKVLDALLDESGANAVLWNRRYDPAGVETDTAIKRGLAQRGVEARSFHAALLFEPHQVMTRAGTAFRVFTPFWNQLRTLPPPAEPLPAPRALEAPRRALESLTVDALALRPTRAWDGGIRATWQFGEQAAQAALREFSAAAVGDYARQRDHPAVAGTSRLSPRLHFGELSPRQVWATASRGGESAQAYLRQLAWRDFAHHLLFNHPHTANAPMDHKYERFPWRTARQRKTAFRAWRRGMTGYPLVDAGMRELYATGWMHNRVRMVVASFLVKHLLIHWLDGARWFWHTLVDADLANNTMGWQWAAGCGADAAPYFRVFNPTLQAQRFDPKGAYIRRHVPELGGLPDKWLSQPWQAPVAVLRAARVTLGETYPEPIVGHTEARIRALEALATLKG